MEWILKRLDAVNTVAGFATLCGLPVSGIFALVAIFWGRAEHLRWSYIAVILLAVFALTLWSWIGTVWLLEKAGSKSKKDKPALDCAWGLAIDAAFLTFDTVNPIACQIAIQIRNLHAWPLRLEIGEHSANVDGVVPNLKTGGSTSIVVIPGIPITISFDGYSQGTIPQKTSYKGIIEIAMKYGHPDIGMTREMSRFYSFELQLQPFPFQMLLPQPVGVIGAVPPPPLVGKFPLPLNLTRSEVDKAI